MELPLGWQSTCVAVLDCDALIAAVAARHGLTVTLAD